MSGDEELPDAPAIQKSVLGKRKGADPNLEDKEPQRALIGVHPWSHENIDLNGPRENGQTTLIKRIKPKQYLNALKDTLIDNKVPFKTDMHGLYLAVDPKLDAEEVHERLEKYARWIPKSESLERRLPLNVVIQGTKADKEEFAKSRRYEYQDYNKAFYLPAGRELADAKEHLPAKNDFKEYMVYLPSKVDFKEVEARGAGYDRLTGAQFIPPGQSISKFEYLKPVLEKQHEDSLSAPTPLTGRSGQRGREIEDISKKHADKGVQTYKFKGQMWADAHSNLAPLREAGLVLDQQSISRYRQVLNPDITKDMAALDLAGWGARRVKDSQERTHEVPAFTPLDPFIKRGMMVSDPPTGIPQPGSADVTEEQKHQFAKDRELVERVRTNANAR